MKELKPWHVVVVSALLLGVGALLVLRNIANTPKFSIAQTVADVHAEHAPVRVGSAEIRGHARLVDGSEVSTEAGGRARVRLDDGSLVVVDEGTRFRLRGQKLKLSAGRIFVQGAAGAHTQVELDDVSTEVSGSSAAFALTKSSRSVYCAQGELLLRRGSTQTHVAAGERAVLEASKLEVSPETAFDDWTGGLAVPWSSHGAGRALVPELFTREADGAGQSLSIRSEKIDVSIEGEFAITRTRTSYFNGSDHAVAPQVRVALPESAIISRVARATGSEEIEAKIAIQRPGEGGAFPSTPSRLEWAGDGWMRGVLPSIESGASVDVLLTYAEWIGTHAGQRTYRFPLASDDPPLIGELRAAVHASGDARLLSTNAGAATTSRHI
ncbi:MAG TPA: FecR domain-containing protein, partial [Polyangiaceae bacterium]|nr:FecR domain-containing protein [Polyangiaceae bacterium]